ncbi:hypothetical protein [Fluviispira multicolorata]|nr:hypothetical protein [Fluviispira multicolorata]
MTEQMIKIHNAVQIPSVYIDIGIILGIFFSILGLVFILYSSKKLN